MTAAAVQTRPTLDPGRLDSVDLTDPRLHAEYDLSRVWARLRDEDPVHWDDHGFWVITRHADVAAVYRDGQRFTSERGNVLETLLGGGDSASGQMAAVTDGPRHAGLRAVLARGFSSAMMNRVVDTMRVAARRLVDAAAAQGECDFALAVAAQVPLAVTCDLLGVPESDRAQILRATSGALAADGERPTQLGTWSAKNEILLYFADLAQVRRERPGDDLISLLVTATVDGRPLTAQEVVFNCYSLVLGGDETTRYAMVGGLHAFMEHPEQWRRFTTGEVSVASAVEEILRWTTPTLHAGRSATTDVLLHGRLIEAGDVVTIWNASANRDERRFTRPERFDIDRNPNPHLTFAQGPHYCIGATLARQELTAVISGLRELVASVEPAGAAQRVYSTFLSGLCALPVRLTPVPR